MLPGIRAETDVNTCRLRPSKDLFTWHDLALLLRVDVDIEY